MSKNTKKYMSKTKHLFLRKLYFGFFQAFEDSNWVFKGLEDWEKPKEVIQKVRPSCRGGGGGGEGESLKSELKRTRGGGGSSLSVLSLCEKNCQIFKQQADFLFISCLIVPKCFLFSFLFSFKFLLWTCKYLYCHCI